MGLCYARPLTVMPDSTGLVSELTDKLAGPLPVIRETSAKLIAQLSSPTTDVDLIVHTIRRDQAFVARVLVIANSPYYSRSPEKITTIKRAILLIGYDVIRDIAIAAEFVELVHKSAESAPRLGRLLARAFVAAHQTTSLCDAIGLPDSETLFTTALLESLGEVALAVHMPEVYEDILSRAYTESLRYDEAHRLITGKTPHDLTVLVADIHTLPKDLILAPPDWGTADWAAADRGAAIVHLTNACARNLFTPDSPQVREDFEEVMALAIRALNLTDVTLTLLLTSAFEKALEFGIDVKLGYRHFAIEPPLADEVPRQKLLRKLAAGYTRTTSRAFELAYRLYSLPI
jgi:HD-like signal output (HDOD) protein